MAGDITVPAGYFTQEKARGTFMNDSPTALYMAVFLWTKYLPLVADRATGLATVVPADAADAIRKRFGRVKAVDVANGLRLLESSRLARLEAGTWTVAWGALGSRGSRELATALAERSCKPPKAHALDKALDEQGLQMDPVQGELFDAGD